MAKLGSPQTNDFNIGTAEVRVGPLAKAGIMTQANSIGVVDSATVTISQEAIELFSSFPQILADTSITKQEATMSATAREFSRTNLKVMLGEGIDATPPSDVSSLVISNIDGTADTDFTVSNGDGTLFDTDDILVIYPEGEPENVAVVRVNANPVGDVIATDNVIPVASTGASSVVNVFKAHEVPIGNVAETNYFAGDVIQREKSTGAPIGFMFWKAAAVGSMSYETNATDYATLEMEFKLLQPAASEYAAGQPLVLMKDIIPGNPTGLFFKGA